MSDRTYGVVLVVVATALFGVTGIVARIAMDGGLDASMVAAVRTYGGALLLLPFVLRARGRYTRAMIAPVALYALIGVFASQGLYFESINRMDVALALVIAYVAPLVVAIYERVREGVALPAYAYAAIVAAIGGLAASVLGAGDVGQVTPIGLVLATACMLTFAVMLILSPRQPSGMSPLARSGAPLIVAGVAWFAVHPVWTVPWDRMGGTVELHGRFDLGLPLWGVVAWLVVLGCVVPFSIILAGSARVGAGTASMLGMTEPVVGSLLAWILLGQTLAPVQVAGIAVTIAAVGVVEHARVRRIGRVEIPDALATLVEPDPR